MKLKNKFTIKGKYKIRTYEAWNWWEKLLSHFGFNIQRKLLRETDWISNLIVLNANRGLNIFIKNLLGDFTNNLEITKAKMGDDDTPPADGDTDLGNVIVDNILVAVRTETGINEATLQFFASDAEVPDGDYKEFGIFCVEQLFARSLISPTYTKSPGEDTQIEYVIEVSNV